MPGKPDLVFHRARVAVFVDGDFWHGKDWLRLQKKLEKGANSNYWIEKIAYNRKRDAQVEADLAQQGWQVVRVWESDVRKSVDKVCDRIVAILDRPQVQ